MNPNDAMGILFSTALRAVLVAKLVILGISPLTSLFLALRVVLVAKLVILGILSSLFFIHLYSIIYIFFNNIIFTTSLYLLKSTGTANNLSTSNLSTFQIL